MFELQGSLCMTLPQTHTLRGRGLPGFQDTLRGPYFRSSNVADGRG